MQFVNLWLTAYLSPRLTSPAGLGNHLRVASLVQNVAFDCAAPKTVKNRVHLCLRPDVRRDIEVERLLRAGARLVEDHRQRGGAGWVVLADPEGNEFCVLRSAAEHRRS